MAEPKKKYPKFVMDVSSISVDCRDYSCAKCGIEINPAICFYLTSVQEDQHTNAVATAEFETCEKCAPLVCKDWKKNCRNVEWLK